MIAKSNKEMEREEMVVNIKKETMYAVGMVERRMVEASTIGKAKSVAQAKATYRSMSACVREVTKHHKNIMSSVADDTALEASQVMSLLVMALEWQARALADAGLWGASDSDLANIDREVFGA